METLPTGRNAAPATGTLEEALHSVIEDWRLTEHAASLCSINVLAVISRRQLRNEILAITKLSAQTRICIRDRRGVQYILQAPSEVWKLVDVPDDPTIPGINGEFLISFRELGSTRIAMVKLNPHPDGKHPAVVTI